MPLDADGWANEEQTEPEGATFQVSTPGTPFDLHEGVERPRRRSGNTLDEQTAYDVSCVFTSNRTLLLEGAFSDTGATERRDPSLFEDVTEPMVRRRQQDETYREDEAVDGRRR